MKLTTTVVECRSYSIVNHVDSCVSSVSKAAAESAPLVCDLTAEALAEREKERTVEGDLIRCFAPACQGEHHRWKLVHILIRECRLTLTFVDLESSTNGGTYKCQTISFQDSLTFRVYADRPGNATPDEYIINFYGHNLYRDRVADIQEFRNSECHALDSIHRWNEKYYLNSYCLL